MTSLKKLGLRGVRSYAQSSEESIEFMKPLTIIVGANGAGKTTIIEALKFATTGTLPPLSDGGKSFVHDPKMDGTNLVKAQVKLSFTTADNKTVLAIRNFQLSQKASKREFKGMEVRQRQRPRAIGSARSSMHSLSLSHRDILLFAPSLLVALSRRCCRRRTSWAARAASLTSAPISRSWYRN
jgi:DNA repair exonuclease SbcCD ATPase subunit